MKMQKHSITFFSFFPVAALLATPLMFSTLAPASSQNFAAEIDSSDWIVPQSQLVLEEFLREQEVRNGEIEEVKFLDYGDSIYGGGENASSLISSSPAILDSGEIETAYILQNPEFQRQVEEVSAQASQAGAAMPPLLTLVALFAFAVATGTSSLKEFFKFSTYTEKVKKTIQVTKKVAKTVYRTITETVARKVKTVKQVAYTAYETVRNVAYNTRTWVTEAIKHKPVTWHPIEQMEMKAKFLLENIRKYAGTGNFTRNYERNLRYLMPPSNLNGLKKEYDDVASGRKVGRYAQNVQHRVWNEGQTLDSQAGMFFDGIADPKLREKLLTQYKSLNDVTYTEQITHSETTPVVTFTEKPYTAYRNEIETKIVYDTVTREVPETIYEDVVEDKEITEDVTKYSFTPLNEKIDLAMGYLKNYTRILQNPSNRNFSDDVLTPNKDIPFFAGAATVYNNLQSELKTANIYNMDRSDPKEVEKLLKRHNEFIYSMKGILTKIQKGETPEEQMGILFGREYTDSMRESENAVAQAEADEKALSARFEEISEMERTNKISTGYARTLYSTAKRNRDQIFRRRRDTEKYLKKTKEEFSRRFNGTIASLQNLSFLRTLDDWRRTLAQGERSTASSLVPFTTANGSVIYRKPAQTTTTQAQPKRTIPQPAPVNLTASNLGVRPADNTAVVATTTAAKIKTINKTFAIGTIVADSYGHTGPGEIYGPANATFKAGKNVKIIGRLDDTSWLQIELQNGTKTWILTDPKYINVKNGLKDVPVVSRPPQPYSVYEKYKFDQLKKQIPYGPDTAKAYFNSWEYQQYLKNLLSFGAGIKTLGIGPLTDADVVEGVISEEKWGVDWNKSDYRTNCVYTVRAFVENAFPEYYGNAKLPTLGSDGGSFVGAAKYMMSGTVTNGNDPILNENAEETSFSEIDVPEFTKEYLKNLPEGTVPPIGSLLVWDNTVGGGSGHIAVVVGTNAEGKTLVMDGNWMEEEKQKKVGIRIVETWDNVLGWMVPNSQIK